MRPGHLPSLRGRRVGRCRENQLDSLRVPLGQLRSVPALDTLLRRDRAIVGGALVGTALVAWLYLFHLSRAMPGMNMAYMPGMAMSRDPAWGVGAVPLLFFMCVALMMAIIAPATAAWVRTVAR